jgi:hypothetical protein
MISYKDENEFEGKIKISNFPSKEQILEKINSYCEKYKTEEKDSLYDIEKENENLILLNFHKNSEIANYINRKLKLLQIEDTNFSDLNVNLYTKIINPKNEKDKEAKKEKSKEKDNENNSKEKSNKNKKNFQIKNYSKDVYNIDAKNNPRLNKLLRRSYNFNRLNMNKCMSPENSKMKIYESIFLGGPYLNRNEIIYEENRKNKAQWLNKKGFVPYISKQTILKNAHMIDNILYKEPAQDKVYPFRPVEKSKWVGKQDFLPYQY